MASPHHQQNEAIPGPVGSDTDAMRVPPAAWLDSHEAAGLLGDKGFVPLVRYKEGMQLYRREQLLKVANAREDRRR